MAQLPQNVKTMLKEIGELSAVLFLHLTLKHEGITRWKVFRSCADEGCDIVLMGPNRQINLEVKTRQSLSVSRNKNQVQFTISEKEKESSDFVLCYWFNKQTFFVVPSEDLSQTTSNGKPLYKFIARYSEQNDDFTGSCRQYAHDWLRIIEAINGGH
jgi:hypothetical protein